MRSEEFNEWYNNGHPVVVTKDDGTLFMTHTRSEAWALGDGTSVVKIDGVRGGVDLERIKPMETHQAI